MKKKVLGLGIIVMLVAMLFVLTGCGDSENIKKFKKCKFSYYLEDTDYTWDEATKKVMSNVKWEEYEKNGRQYIKISGTEKSTKKKIEIIYKHYTGDGWSRDEFNIDGRHYDPYFGTLFEKLVEK